MFYSLVYVFMYAHAWRLNEYYVFYNFIFVGGPIFISLAPKNFAWFYQSVFLSSFNLIVKNGKTSWHINMLLRCTVVFIFLKQLSYRVYLLYKDMWSFIYGSASIANQTWPLLAINWFVLNMVAKLFFKNPLLCQYPLD